MTVKKYFKVWPGERVDAPDMRHAVEGSQRLGHQQVFDDFCVWQDKDAGRAKLIRGFYIDFTASSNTLKVNDALSTTKSGLASLGALVDGVVTFGNLVRADSTKTFNTSSYGNATFDVYIRAEFADSDIANRRFWNPDAGTPTNYVQAVATRIADDWSIAVESSSPGDEWLKIGAVTKSGGVITSVTNALGSYLFEGSSTATHTIQDADWGTTNDRSTASDNRRLYGIGSLRRFAMAVFRQIQDIIGGGSFWFYSIGSTPGSGSRSLTDLNEGKLETDGSMQMAGNLYPDTNEAYSLGSNGSRWLDISGRAVFAYDDGLWASIGSSPGYGLVLQEGNTAGGTPVSNAVTFFYDPSGGDGATPQLVIQPNYAAPGTGQVKIDATQFKPGMYGQKMSGILFDEHVQFTIPATGTAAGASNNFSASFFPATTPSVLVGDKIIGWRVVGTDPAANGLLITNVTIPSTNTVRIDVYNPTGAAKPAALINVDLYVTILLTAR